MVPSRSLSVRPTPARPSARLKWNTRGDAWKGTWNEATSTNFRSTSPSENPRWPHSSSTEEVGCGSRKTAAGGAEMTEADVYQDGVLVARYRWPGRVRAGALPWVTESALYGTTTDSLGVQRAARVRFEPGP